MVGPARFDSVELPARRIAAYVARALRRPRPLAVLYAITAVPSLLFALLLAWPLLELSRYPLLRQALERRSLGDLIEVFSRLEGAPSAWPLIALLGGLLVSLLLLVVRVYLQGGTLLTYAVPQPLTRREFHAGCRRWFGSFFLLNLLGSCVILLPLGLVVVGWGLASYGGGAVGLLLLLFGALIGGLIILVIEMARAAAVVRDDRNVGHALVAAGRGLWQRPHYFLGLAALGVLLQVGLYGLARLVGGLSIPAWFLSLILLQLVALARLLVRLGRWAGEVGIYAEFMKEEEL